MSGEFGPPNCPKCGYAHQPTFDCRAHKSPISTETPRTMRCWRDGRWHTDELANLAAKLERENVELEATINTLHNLCVSAEKRVIKKMEEERPKKQFDGKPKTERQNSMHSKNGRPINVGDKLLVPNGNHTFVGVVVQTMPNAHSCNVYVVPLRDVQLNTAGECLHVDDILAAKIPDATIPRLVPPEGGDSKQ